MVKITIEAPESAVGDIYFAVGEVFQGDQEEQDEAAESRRDCDEPADET